MNIDVVSCGEIYTAAAAGYPMENCFFHGNNKTDSDIAFAMENEVGFFVVDSEEELFAIDQIAKEKGVKQKILLRVTPGIDTHTHEKISTGNIDSKFGIAIDTNQAKETDGKILKLSNVEFLGFHCHIGSQIFDSEPFDLASELMFTFISDIKATYGYIPEVLNLGGGFGVRYIDSDPKISFTEKIAEIAEVLKKQSKAFSIPRKHTLN